MRMRRGQVMIIAVLAIGGTLLGASAIAGLLTIFQIRQSTDLANSTRAIYAADAGLEWALYEVKSQSDRDAWPAISQPTFSNGATVSITIDAVTGEIKSVGSSGKSSRAFQLFF